MIQVFCPIFILILCSFFSDVAAEGQLLKASEKAEIKVDAGVSSRYAYNVYFDTKRAISDELLVLNPEITWQTKPSNFFFDGTVTALYEKFLSQSIQDHFDYDVVANAKLYDESTESFKLSGRYHQLSDPSPNEKYGRLSRTQIDGALSGKFKFQSSNSFEAKVHYFSEDFVNPTLGSKLQASPNALDQHYLANSTLEGIAQYNIAFLPETAWFFRASGGSTQYPLAKFATASDGTPIISGVSALDATTMKNASTYGFGETGVQGRLTDKSTIDFSTGYLYRSYADGFGFAGPVFYVHFTEQITRRDQLMAGYDYEVKDSYWTDYFLDQQIYLGLARVVGDQVILLSRVAYDYRSFSLPNRRDDERVTGSFVIKYSMSPTVKLTADLKVDLLSSDAYNTAATLSNPDGKSATFLDNPASYKAGSFGLGMIASF